MPRAPDSAENTSACVAKDFARQLSRVGLIIHHEYPLAGQIDWTPRGIGWQRPAGRLNVMRLRPWRLASLPAN